METTPQDIDGSLVGIATSFDGSWKSPGCSNKRGIAIMENTSEVVDIMFKSSTCRECEKVKEKHQAGKINEVAYINRFLMHEEQCLQNHDGSAQIMTYPRMERIWYSEAFIWCYFHLILLFLKDFFNILKILANNTDQLLIR